MNQPRALQDKLPPVDYAAEEAVIASLMVDPDAFDRIDDLVSAGDFHRDSNRLAFGACRSLWQRHDPINELTVAHELSRSGNLDDVGGVPYLARIVGDLPTPIGVEHYAQIVHRDARYRGAISAGAEIVRRAYEGGPDIDGFCSWAEKLVGGLGEESGVDGFVMVGDLAQQYWDEPGIASGETRMLRTGIMALDDVLEGIAHTDLVVLAAQTGFGKSNALLNLAYNAARGQNFRVGIVSLEMSEREWRDRLFARMTGIDSRRIRRNDLTDDEERRVMDATAEAQSYAIGIDDRKRGNVTLAHIRASVRRLRAKLGGLELLIVDYLQLVGSTRQHDNRATEVGQISRGLKMLAREIDAPIVAASQLSRESGRRTKPNEMVIPMLSDLRESGSIEQDADSVIFLCRKQDAHGRPEGNGVSFVVAKHRSGRLGTGSARIIDATSTIEDIAPQAEPEPEYQEPMPWAK